MREEDKFVSKKEKIMRSNKDLKLQKFIIDLLNKDEVCLKYIVNGENFYGSKYFVRKVPILYLNETFFKSNTPSNDFVNDYSLVERQEQKSEIKMGRRKIKPITFYSGEKEVNVDPKFLEYFEDDCSYYIKNAYSAIVVKLKEETIGFIMPLILSK
jgi:hypothetical protein